MLKHNRIAACFAAGFLLAAGLTASKASRADGVVPNRLIVHVNARNDSEANRQAARINHDYGGHTEGRFAGTHIFVLQFSNADNPQALQNQLSSDNRVVWVEPDTYVAVPEAIPAPTLPSVNADPFHFPFDRTSSPQSYHLQRAYRQINAGHAEFRDPQQGVIIAVLDTGVAASHPALQNHLIPGFNTLSPDSAPDDAADGLTNAAVGHGTMIAGLAAALAPNAHIMPVRVLNGDGVGTAFSVALGIQYAVQHGAKVINLSLTSATPSQILAETIQQAEQAGVLVVAAAGNGGGSVVCYPAACPDVLAVSSVEANGVKSDFANYGVFVSVVAPGSAIASAYADGGYARGSGTSFAAPFAAIEAALMFAANPYLTPQGIRERITATAHPIDFLNPLYAHQLGAGLIDIDSGIEAVHDDFGSGESGGDDTSGHGPGSEGGMPHPRFPAHHR